MSATRTDDSTAGVSGQGEFSSRIPRDEPLTTSGHKPGVKASPADNAPEFSAQTLPAGSAPSSRTFQANPEGEAPPLARYDGDADPESGAASASDTIGGATSADVHAGLGHPGQGQTSSELRHDGQKGRAKQGLGLVGQASSTATGAALTGPETVGSDDPRQRGLDDDAAAANAGKRGNLGGPPAEERVPEGPDTVASEAPRG